MKTLSLADFHLLSPAKLADRIDAFYSELNAHVDAGIRQSPNHVQARQILTTKALEAASDSLKKRALMFFHRANFQSAICREYGGIANVLIHNPSSDMRKWIHPGIQVANAALRQAEVVASRIAVECLMELIHLIETGDLIPSKKSKVGVFRKWCSVPGNRFGWFVFYLLVVNHYDKTHRTPEVHGTSYIAEDALRCGEWPRQDTETNLQNLLLNIWPSVIQTLNDQPVTSMFSTPPFPFKAEDFFNWKAIDLLEFWSANA